MKVVILCGGRGTRIRDVADDIPKPLIQIGGRPILWHIMKYYATFGHTDFVLCLGYKGDLIKHFFLNYPSQTRDLTVTLGTGAVDYHSDMHEAGWRVTMVDTGLDTQTGARLRRVRAHVGDEPFMLTYGDGVGNVDLTALKQFHASHEAVMTLTGVHPPGRFGEVVAGADGMATEFNEKPQTTTGLISGGFFVCDPRLFAYLGSSDDVSLEDGPMRTLAAERRLAVFPHAGFWQPMDTYRDYQLLTKRFVSGEAPWATWR